LRRAAVILGGLVFIEQQLAYLGEQHLGGAAVIPEKATSSEEQLSFLGELFPKKINCHNAILRGTAVTNGRAASWEEQLSNLGEQLLERSRCNTWESSFLRGAALIPGKAASWEEQLPYLGEQLLERSYVQPCLLQLWLYVDLLPVGGRRLYDGVEEPDGKIQNKSVLIGLRQLLRDSMHNISKSWKP
jgi:hypothetical protein